MEKTLELLVKKVMEADDFTEEVKQSAEAVIIDTLVAILYGLKTEDGIQNLIQDKNTQTGITLPGTDIKLNNRDALLALGTAVVANELDEGNTYAKGHPSAHILPVVYTTALEDDYTMAEIIDAYIRGYEISTRLSYAFKMKDNMHPHGTWGNVGGAVTRAILQKKTTKEIINIINLTLSLPLATNWLAAEKGQTVRNLYTGYGNVIAYETVDLVSYGFTSNSTVVEDLWGNIMGTGIAQDKLTENLLNPPMIHQNYFKVHPTCRFTHASIETAEQAKNNIKPKNIESITINTYNLAARCNTKNIQTRLESKFSIPYAVACAIYGLNLYDDYHVNLNIIGEFIEKIEVIDSEEITQLLPKERAAECIITDTEGNKHTAFVSNARGEFSHPFSKQELKNKYKNMLAVHYRDIYSEAWLDDLMNINRSLSFKEWLLNNKLLRS